MRVPACVATAIVLTAGVAVAGPASGTVKSQTGTISPKYAVAYLVRDSRSPRNTRVEVLLTEVAIGVTALRDNLDPHATAITIEERDALQHDEQFVIRAMVGDRAKAFNHGTGGAEGRGDQRW